MAKYIGIDYSLGQANVDKTNGIHYGVISQGSVGEAWYESSEAQYGPATCPKCGNDAEEIPAHSEQLENGVAIVVDMPDEFEEFEQYSKHGCADYACRNCEITLDSSDCFGDEAQGYTFEDAEYSLESAFDNTTIFVTKSPYYTFAAFCSPCAPGAGDLDTPADGGVKTYCLGSEWFEDEKAPYPVYRVADDSRAD
jgi:hypothetical protein